MDAQVADDQKHLDDEKSGKATAEEDKATAEKDLDVTMDELTSQTEQLATARGSCLQTAADKDIADTIEFFNNDFLKVTPEARGRGSLVWRLDLPAPECSSVLHWLRDERQVESCLKPCVKVESCLKPYCEPAAFVACLGSGDPCSNNQGCRGDPCLAT